MSHALTLQSSTRIAVQVIVEDETGRVVAFLAALTTLIGMLVGVGHFVAYVVGLVQDIHEAITFVNRVYIIIFKALAYGFLGVNLR